MGMSIFLAYMYGHHVCTWCPEARDNVGSCYRGSQTAMWVTGLEPRSSAIATSALNHWAISLASRLLIKKGKGTLKSGSGLENWGISPQSLLVFKIKIILWGVRLGSGARAWHGTHVEVNKEQLSGVGFSLHFYLSSRDWPQVIRLSVSIKMKKTRGSFLVLERWLSSQEYLLLLAEDLGSTPSTHMATCNSVTPVPGNLNSSFGLNRHRVRLWYTYILRVCRPNSHTHKSI